LPIFSNSLYFRHIAAKALAICGKSHNRNFKDGGFETFKNQEEDNE